MAALPWRIISEILRSKDMTTAMRLGLSKQHLKGDPEAGEVFEFIRQHYQNPKTYKQFPLIRTIKRRWPAFEMTSKTDAGRLATLIQELKSLTYETDLRALVSYFGDLVQEDPVKAAIVIQQELAALRYHQEGQSGMSMPEIANKMEEMYDEAQKGLNYGIPWPWDPLTNDTMGKSPGDFHVLYGRMKSMKCVCEGQRIMQPDGSLVPIEQLPEQPIVPSYTTMTGKVRWASARRVVSGTKTCVEVTTASGLRLRTSDEHLYMIPGGGYARIKDLAPGDRVATVNRLRFASVNEERSWEEIVSIEDIGQVPCYDICITDGLDPNFVVEGFIVHNTWLELFSAVEDFTKHNRRVLLWSREMNAPKLVPRICSIIAGVDYQVLKHGRLPPEPYRRFKDSLQKIAAMVHRSMDELKEGATTSVPDLIVLCGREAPKSLEELATYIDILRPEIVYIDSFYHLTSERSAKYKQDHEQQKRLVEDIKTAAMDLNVPIVGAAQANREGEKSAGEHMADVAGTDAIGREADGIYRVIMRRGKDMWEEEYEGYWESTGADKAVVAELHEQRHAALVKVPVSKKVQLKGMESASKVSNVLKEVAAKEKATTVEARKSAEIALIPAGNREGVMDGLLLHVVPGYRNKILRDDFTPKEAKEWRGEDEDRGPKQRRKRDDEPPTDTGGASFGGLPRTR